MQRQPGELTPQEAAERMQVSMKTLNHLVVAGCLPRTRMIPRGSGGRLAAVSSADVLEFNCFFPRDCACANAHAQAQAPGKIEAHG